MSIESEQGESLDDLVSTGEPHVTVATAPGVKAYLSGPAITAARTKSVLKPVPEGLGVLEATLELVVPDY